MIGGVCSGLGHYFDLDTILVRVAFVVFALAGGGGGVLAYLVLWAVLDPAPPGQLDPPTVAATGPSADPQYVLDLDERGLDRSESPTDPQPWEAPTIEGSS